MARFNYETSVNSEFNIYTWHIINEIVNALLEMIKCDYILGNKY